MAHTTSADRALGLLVVLYSGPVEGDELLTVAEELEKGDLPTACPLRLHDLRGWRGNLPTETLRRIADGAHARRQHLPAEARMARRVAFLVSNDLAFGLARMLEVMVEDHEREQPLARAFRDFDRARAWLGLPAEHPDPRLGEARARGLPAGSRP